MDKGINNNGFDYVDLELPSGTLWAAMNVGASSPSDFGLYFQWGDTIGYTEDQLGFGEGKKKVIWGDYKWSINGSDSNFSKYKDIGIVLDLEDDAAHVHMGGDWHMPTPIQIQELLGNTTSIRKTLDDVNGVMLTSKKDEAKSIFIPSTGFAWYGSIFDMDGAVYNKEGDGNIWSSMTSMDHVNCGYYLGFDSGYASLSRGERSVGMSVRGVIG